MMMGMMMMGMMGMMVGGDGDDDGDDGGDDGVCVFLCFDRSARAPPVACHKGPSCYDCTVPIDTHSMMVGGGPAGECGLIVGWSGGGPSGECGLIGSGLLGCVQRA